MGYIQVTQPGWLQIFLQPIGIDLAWKKPLLTGASGMSGYKVWVDDGNGGNIANLIWDGGTKASTLYYSWQPVFSDGSVALLAGHTYRFQVGK